MTNWERGLRFVVAFVVLVLFGLAACGLVLRQHEMAVVARFGEPRTVLREAGLFWKLPYPIETVYRFDRRIRMYDTRFAETLTRDQRNVIVLTYVAWRIDDPLRFFQAMGTASNAELKLDGLVTHAKNTALGNYDLSALVSTSVEDLRIPRIEEEILEAVAPSAKANYGIEILQVGIKRLAFPESNVRYVFDQMRAERARFAAQFRADGEKKASDIRSKTDLRKAEILAEARKEAETIRGRAEADAARLYATAHRKDPEFYMFQRSLESVKRILGARSTIILGTDAAPFSVLHGPSTAMTRGTTWGDPEGRGHD